MQTSPPRTASVIDPMVELLFEEWHVLDADGRRQFDARGRLSSTAQLTEFSALVAAAEQAESYFQKLQARFDISRFAADDDLSGVERRFGAYRLIRLLGRGGMGAVYLAERADDEFEKLVALKVLPFGMDDPASVARFRTERQILARLEHPNIARLLDGGVSEDGIPYYVMDYVAGTPIDVYCQEHDLDLAQRLRLFLQVCEAVHFAHRNLVVHRDLKPGNVLVGTDGTAKLLDFGIARILAERESDRVDLTGVAGRLLTPDYAAPELFTGGPVTVTTDVYSLGVLLYQMLTGDRPYRLPRDLPGGFIDAHARIAIARPSSVAPPPRRAALRGDVDAVVLNALRHDPQARYPTVRALSDDIENFLARRPVKARPERGWYRMRRFVSRNRLGVGVATVLLSVIAAGTTIALWQATEARDQRNRANAEAQAARRSAHLAGAQASLNGFLLSDFAVNRSASDMEKQLERAITFVNKTYGQDGPARVQLMLDLAGRFRHAGNLKRHAQLLAEIEPEASALGEEDVLARIRCWRARDQSAKGQVSEARELVQREVVKLRSRNAPVGLLTFCLSMSAVIERAAGNAAGSMATMEEVRDIERTAGLADTGEHAETQFLLARAYSQLGRFRDASRAADESARIHAANGLEESSSMAQTQVIRGRIARLGGRPDLALGIFDAELARHLQRGGTLDSVQVLAWDRGMTLLSLGRAREALESLRSARDSAQRHGDIGTLGSSVTGLARGWLQDRQPERARRELDEAWPIFDKNRLDGVHLARQYLFARAWYGLAVGDRSMVAEMLAVAKAQLDQLDNKSGPDTRDFLELSARQALLEGRPADALPQVDSALRLARSQAIDPQLSVFVADLLFLQADALRALGRTDEAAAAAQQGAAQYRSLGIADPNSSN